MRTLSAVLLLSLGALQSQVPCKADFDGPLFLDTWSMGGPNLLLGIKFTTGVTPLAASRIEVFTGEKTGINTIAIYSHNAALNQPLTSLGNGSWSMSSINSWQGANLNTTVPILPNTTFWVVWGPQNGAQTPTAGYGVNPAPPGAQEYRGSFDNGANWNGPFFQHQWKVRIYCSRSPGDYVTYGSGCPGSNRATPVISNNNVPTIGGTTDILLAGAPAATAVILTVGTSNSSWAGFPLPLSLASAGAPGCSVLNGITLMFVQLSTANGTATQTLSFPNSTVLVGGALYNQWIVQDVPANTLGLTLSNGGKGIIGD